MQSSLIQTWHFQIRAVVLYNEAVREADLELRCQQQAATQVVLDEEIFISQLHRRAVLLNHDFQHRVFDTIAQHAAGTDEALPPVRLHSTRHQVAIKPSSSSSLLIQDPLLSSASLVFNHERTLDQSITRCDSASKHYTTSERSNQNFENCDSMSKEYYLADSNSSISSPNRTSSGSSQLQCRKSLLNTQHSSMLEIRRIQGEYGELQGTRLLCTFRGNVIDAIDVWPAIEKSPLRMREKLIEYANEGITWPRCAQILDPVRASVVCGGPAQMLEVADWFLQNGGSLPELSRIEESKSCEAGRIAALPVCRIKNKFAFSRDELVRNKSFIFVKSNGNFFLQMSHESIKCSTSLPSVENSSMKN
jgi:hypothetical protein